MAHADLEKTLFTDAQISARVKEVGASLAGELASLKPLILVVLRGSFMFASDLCKAIQPVPAGLHVDFVRCSSYEGTASTGNVEIEVDDEGSVSEENLKGRHVVLVEDICDTGVTCKTLVELIKSRGAASVRTVVLLDKKARRRTEFTPDVIGFECPDEFVVGYGLDYEQEYRTLPYIGVLKAEKYTK